MTMSISPASIAPTNSAARAGRPDGVGGDDRGARVGEQLGDLVGDALDAGPAGDEAVLLAAFGAGLGRRHDMAAMVAGEAVHQAVLDHPGGAVGALEAVAAVAAQGQRREAAAVEEQQRLLAALEVRLNLADQVRREPAAARRRVLGQVERRGSRAWSRRRSAAAATLRGSGRSRPYACSRSPASPRTRITGMSSNLARITAMSRAWYWTPSSCLKLGSCASSTTIRPRLGIGQEQRRARADDDPRLAAGDPAPGAAPLRLSAGPNARRPGRSRSAPRSA